MKKLMLFFMWLVASAGAVGVAWAGVSVVDNQVVDPPSVAEIASSPLTSVSDSSDVSQDTTNPVAQPSSTVSASTTEPIAGSPTSTVPATTSSTSPQPAATTQTFALTGGTAAISFSSSGVEVLWATPNPGFEVRVEPESPGIKVEFRADNHRSRVDAWWSGGPQHSIREEPRD